MRRAGGLNTTSLTWKIFQRGIEVHMRFVSAHGVYQHLAKCARFVVVHDSNPISYISARFYSLRSGLFKGGGLGAAIGCGALVGAALAPEPFDAFAVKSFTLGT